jgi:hypothetical protein
VLLVFGVASLSVAIPRSQRDGVTVSGVDRHLNSSR